MTASVHPVLVAALAVALACQSSSPRDDEEEGAPMPIETRPFGTTADGQAVAEIVLTNRGDVRAHLITYGATLTQLWVPDREGRLADVVLGFDDLAGYQSEANQYFGCSVGRVANRIAAGRFAIGQARYQLATNDPPNHLHGGVRGFDKVVWAAETEVRPEGPAAIFRYDSPAYEEGYPGSLSVTVTYTLTHEHELRIDYAARADATTPVNLTHHSYFNLAGAGAPTVLDHELTVFADRYTPTDDTLIPTGEIASVIGTPLDFRRGRPIGESIDEVADTAALGYDHNLVLAMAPRRLSHACTLREPRSGRVMEVWTTEPGLQLYSGNFLYGQAGKLGRPYAQRSAVCLEAQHFPDSVNHPGFPSILLDPDEAYVQTTVHRFGTQEGQ